MSAEEAYQMVRGRPDSNAQTLDLLDRQTNRKIQQQNILSEENAQHQRDMYGAGEKALQTGVNQYDKSYARNYQEQRDARTEGRADEMQKAQMESLNRQNRMAGAEESYGNEAGTAGKPRWQQEREDKLKRENARADLDSASARSGIAMNNASIKNMVDTNNRVQEEIARGDATKAYQAALSVPGDDQSPAKLKALAAVDAAFPKLSPQARASAKTTAQGNIKNNVASQDLLVASSNEGQIAQQKLGELDAKVQHLAGLNSDIQEFKKAIPFTSEEDAAYQRVAAKLDAIKPGTAQVLQSPINPVTGSKATRMQQAMTSVETDLRGEYARLKSQHQRLPSTQIQGQIQGIEKALNDIAMMRQGLGRNSVDLLNGGQGGNAMGNRTFLTGGMGGGMPPQQQQGQALPISFQGKQPMAAPPPAPSMRQSQVNRQ